MGLCDEERISGLFFSIGKLVSLSEGLEPKNSDTERLSYLIDQLWHAFLGNTSNPSHWLMGSGSSNGVTWGSASPWGVAINYHCKDITSESEDESEVFNALDSFLDIPHLLYM